MELIDIYTINKVKTGKKFVRNQDILNDNEYYLLEQGWIINDNNEILLTQRNLAKSHGGLWESTAGHVKSGETDFEAIKREINEELGVVIPDSCFKFIKSIISKHTILDVWVIRTNVDLKDVKLQKDEVINVKYVSISEFIKMIEKKEVINKLSYFIEIYNSL